MRSHAQRASSDYFDIKKCRFYSLLDKQKKNEQGFGMEVEFVENLSFFKVNKLVFQLKC